MAKRGKTNNNNCNGLKNGHIWWQSAASNQMVFTNFQTQILNMALTRFQWCNLPETCDERYLEWSLLFTGSACICEPGNGNGPIMSLQAVQQGINAYGNPKSWRAIGDNGTSFYSNWVHGAFIFDNMMRLPIIPSINMYASDLAELRQLKRTNRNTVKTPYIITGPKSSKQSMINLYKQVDGNEPAIIADDDIGMIRIDAVQTGVQYIAHDIDEDIENTWRKIYALLGIQNLPYKAERQTDTEINDFTEPTEFTKMNPLLCRQRAARAVNRALGTNIQVIWRHDWLGGILEDAFTRNSATD